MLTAPEPSHSLATKALSLSSWDRGETEAWREQGLGKGHVMGRGQNLGLVTASSVEARGHMRTRLGQVWAPSASSVHGLIASFLHFRLLGSTPTVSGLHWGPGDASDGCSSLRTLTVMEGCHVGTGAGRRGWPRKSAGEAPARPQGHSSGPVSTHTWTCPCRCVSKYRHTCLDKALPLTRMALHTHTDLLTKGIILPLFVHLFYSLLIYCSFKIGTTFLFKI